MMTRLIASARRLSEDVDTVLERDPSVRSRREALLHPSVTAVWAHRIAHRLHRRRHRMAARALTGLAKIATGIEIHAGAIIGRRFFVDHGAGVVIGETAIVGDDVTVFHQVTLGSIGWWHDRRRPEGSRRHPRVGDRVVIGSGATLLGPISVGDDCVLGAQALVLADVPASSRVLAPRARVEPRAGGIASVLPLPAAGTVDGTRAAAGGEDGRIAEIPGWAAGW